MSQLLKVNDLTVTVGESSEAKRILDQVSFEVSPLNITALVGGSGSGKTTTGLSILNLLSSGLRLQQGEILFNGENLVTAGGERIRKIRGGDISMVFQEPLNAFNPVFSLGYQIEEVLQAHTDLNPSQRRERVFDLFNVVGLENPKRVAQNYPHQLSGGMRQRAMIAQAIAGDPRLIIADEPTSNLDVTLQAHIIELFKKLKADIGFSILLITHDLGMVEHLADDVVVMTNGRVVECGATGDVLNNPQHEYTSSLMEALQM